MDTTFVPIAMKRTMIGTEGMGSGMIPVTFEISSRDADISDSSTPFLFFWENISTIPYVISYPRALFFPRH